MEPKARRRLAQWIDEKGNTMYGIRIQPFWAPIGTYGYMAPEPAGEKAAIEATITSGTVILANTIAALAVDAPGTLAIIVLGIGTGWFLKNENWWKFAYGEEPGNKNMTWIERIKALLDYRTEAHGFSAVFNVIAGYLAYNVIFNKDARKIWLPWVGAAGTIFSNVLVLATEKKGLEHTNHFAHFGGFAYGFLYAWLINRFWRKKTHGVGFLRRNDVIITLVISGVIIFQYLTLTDSKKYQAKQALEHDAQQVEMREFEEDMRERFEQPEPYKSPNENLYRQARELGIKGLAVDIGQGVAGPDSLSQISSESLAEPLNAPAYGSEYYHTQSTESGYVNQFDPRFY